MWKTSVAVFACVLLGAFSLQCSRNGEPTVTLKADSKYQISWLISLKAAWKVEVWNTNVPIATHVADMYPLSLESGNSRFSARVILSGLDADTEYAYRLICSSEKSQTYTFKTRMPPSVSEPSLGPQQVHLSATSDPSVMRVVWATASDGFSLVWYGTVSGQYFGMSQGSTNKFVGGGNEEGLQYYHHVELLELTPNTKYYYACETNGNRSEEFSFVTMDDDEAWAPSFLVFGDLGIEGGQKSIELLNAEAASGKFAAAIHVGDFAYDLHDDGGKRGDRFMDSIQPLTASLPYMTCVGNHEIPNNFSHYINRFDMPTGESSGGEVTPTARMWYSWNAGLIHFVSYSSEVFFVDEAREAIAQQLEWLKADLEEANTPESRERHPWIVAFGHRPMYCSNSVADDCHTNDKMRVVLEPLFRSNGVDLVFEGHKHSYERTFPVYDEVAAELDYTNPTAPVHIIAGAAGCYEGIESEKAIGDRSAWSAFANGLRGYTGYGHLTAFNATHLYWDQVLSEHDGHVLDSFWLVQEHHGAFSTV